MSSKKKRESSKKAQREGREEMEEDVAAAAASVNSAAAAAAAAPLPVAAAAAAAAPAAAAAAAPTIVAPPHPYVYIPPPLLDFPPAAPAPLQPAFTNNNTVGEIMAVINNPAISNDMKTWSLTKLTKEKFKTLFTNPALTPEEADALLTILTPHPYQLMSLRQNTTIPEPLRRRMANIIVKRTETSLKRRRKSLAPSLRETQRKETRREVIGFPSDICGGTDPETTLAFLRVFTSINLLGCSSSTKCILVSTKRDSEEHIKHPDLVGVLTIVAYSPTSRGEHLRAYCKVGTSWYTAEGDTGILQKRTAGCPVWETRHSKSERIVHMIFCYAGVPQILERLPPPFNTTETSDFQGFPIFSQSGRGTCSVDSLSSIFLYCNGYRNIMLCAMNTRPNGHPSVTDLISQHFTSRFPDHDSIRAALLALQPDGSRVYTMSEADANQLRTQVTKVFNEIIGPQTLAPYDVNEPPVKGVNTEVLDIGERSSIFMKKQGPTGDFIPSNDLLALFVRSPLATAAIRYTLFSFESTITSDINSRGAFFRANTRKLRNKSRGRKNTVRRKYIQRRFEKIQQLRERPLPPMNPSEKRRYKHRMLRAMARGVTNENIARGKGLTAKKRTSQLPRKAYTLTQRARFF